MELLLPEYHYDCFEPSPGTRRIIAGADTCTCELSRHEMGCSTWLSDVMPPEHIFVANWQPLEIGIGACSSNGQKGFETIG